MSDLNVSSTMSYVICVALAKAATKSMMITQPQDKQHNKKPIPENTADKGMFINVTEPSQREAFRYCRRARVEPSKASTCRTLSTFLDDCNSPSLAKHISRLACDELTSVSSTASLISLTSFTHVCRTDIYISKTEGCEIH